MKYLLTIYGDESSWSDATPEQTAGAMMDAYGTFGEEVTATARSRPARA